MTRVIKRLHVVSLSPRTVSTVSIEPLRSIQPSWHALPDNNSYMAQQPLTVLTVLSERCLLDHHVFAARRPLLDGSKHTRLEQLCDAIA